MRQIRKMFTFSSHVLFYYLAWQYAWPLVKSGSTAGLAGHCLVLSTIFLVVIYGLFVHILRSYGNIFTRLLAMETLLWGVPLSLVAICVGPEPIARVLASVSLTAWLYFAYRY